MGGDTADRMGYERLPLHRRGPGTGAAGVARVPGGVPRGVARRRGGARCTLARARDGRRPADRNLAPGSLPERPRLGDDDVDAHGPGAAPQRRALCKVPGWPHLHVQPRTLPQSVRAHGAVRPVGGRRTAPAVELDCSLPRSVCGPERVGGHSHAPGDLPRRPGAANRGLAGEHDGGCRRQRTARLARLVRHRGSRWRAVPGARLPVPAE